jgi:predicted HAD superfamily Cof-like phosphohydrolase
MQTKAYNQILQLATSPVPHVKRMAKALLSPSRTMESMLRAWHLGMGAHVRDTPTTLNLKDVERRLRLTLEEFLELVKHSGFTVISNTTGEEITKDLRLVPVPGEEQNLIEIADGLGDIIVVCLGHAAEHGIYLEPVFNEIMFSNGTKISIDGVKRINRYVDSETGLDCNVDDPRAVLLSPSDPVGKILKPESYIKADLKTVLEEQGDEDALQTTFAFDS